MEKRRYCAQPPVVPILLSQKIDKKRAQLIHTLSKKWVNGTTLKYYFFDRDNDGGFLEDTNIWKPWKGTDGQKEKVRKGFEIWKNVGIGLDFKEVLTREEADIRIGFMEGDGSWSYVGRDILNKEPYERTMNFGWDIDTDDQYNGIDTVIHEIGHTIGFQHEHQNYKAGIVWDEDAVYESFEESQGWKPEKIYDNILKKISSFENKGTNWDPNSIMEYPFPPYLIKQPIEYYTTGLTPAGGLSDIDITYVKTLYPLKDRKMVKLEPLKSYPIDLKNSKQQDFEFEPPEDGKYTIQAFGEIDSVLVLFSEEEGGELKYLSGDDNGGIDAEVQIKWEMLKAKRYIIKLRLYYKKQSEKAALMIWK